MIYKESNKTNLLECNPKSQKDLPSPKIEGPMNFRSELQENFADKRHTIHNELTSLDGALQLIINDLKNGEKNDKIQILKEVHNKIQSLQQKYKDVHALEEWKTEINSIITTIKAHELELQNLSVNDVETMSINDIREFVDVMILTQTTEIAEHISEITPDSLKHPTPLRLKKINLQKCLEGLKDEIESEIKALAKEMEKDIITVFTNIPRDKVFIKADWGKIRTEVIAELITNAVKYISKDGKIEIFLRKTDENAQLIFTNSITEETADELRLSNNLEEIFKCGFRVGQNTVGFEGSGLGLHIIKEIIEKHKGKIEASITTNNEINKINFVIELPLVQ
ncbi:MAG: ATP-binding protein [Candidatus Micrarchaeota archaeon]